MYSTYFEVFGNATTFQRFDWGTPVQFLYVLPPRLPSLHHGSLGTSAVNCVKGLVGRMWQEFILGGNILLYS